jgi:hypothetical protein
MVLLIVAVCNYFIPEVLNYYGYAKMGDTGQNSKTAQLAKWSKALSNNLIQVTTYDTIKGLILTNDAKCTNLNELSGLLESGLIKEVDVINSIK